VSGVPIRLERSWSSKGVYVQTSPRCPSRQSLLMVFLTIFCFLMIGCGRPSWEGREAKDKAEHEEASRKRK